MLRLALLVPFSDCLSITMQGLVTRLALLLLSAALQINHMSAQSDSATDVCDAGGLHILESSTTCSAYCDSFEPCIVWDSAVDGCGGNGTSGSFSFSVPECVYANNSTDGDAACAFQCAYSDTTTFTMYLSTRAITDFDYGDEVGYFSANGDQLRAIGTLELNPLTVTVYVTLCIFRTGLTVVLMHRHLCTPLNAASSRAGRVSTQQASSREAKATSPTCRSRETSFPTKPK